MNKELLSFWISKYGKELKLEKLGTNTINKMLEEYKKMNDVLDGITENLVKETVLQIYLKVVEK